MESLKFVAILVLIRFCQSTIISARLSGGSLLRNGFVQVKINGTWAYLCDTHNYPLTNRTLDTACRQLGYESGLPVPGTSLNVTENVKFWRSDIACDRYDMDLKSCSNTGFQLTSTCPRDISQTWCLTLGHFDAERQLGFVYMYKNHSFWTLCTSEFGSNEANAFCKENGFTTGSTNEVIFPAASSQPTNDSLPAYSMLITSYKCSLNDDKLSHCGTVPSTCTTNHFPAVAYCTGRLDLIGRVNKLKPSQDYSTSFGQLMMYGTLMSYNFVCADNFGDAEAQVACKDAGFHGIGKALPPYYRTPGSTKSALWGWSYSCTGNETRLADCVNTTLSHCPIEKGCVGVACDIPQTVKENSTRILSSGRVEVFSSGIWNPVSSVFWGKIGADVVCRREGFDGGEAYRNDYDPYIPWWNCAWKVHYSCHDGNKCQVIRDEEEATIKSHSVGMAACYKSDSSIIYSLDGGAKNYGYVVITKDGYSGYVADLDPKHSSNFVDTTCRSLGYYSGDPFTIETPFLENFNTTRVVYNCSDGYPFLHRCSGFQWDCPDADKGQCKNKLISVYCYGKLKLGSGYLKNSGLVLNYKYNNYFTFCADNFKTFEADLVCKKLGFLQSKTIISSQYLSTNQDYFRRLSFSLECPKEAQDYDQCSSRYIPICKTGKAAVLCDNGLNDSEKNKAQFLFTLLNLGLVISLTF